MSNLFIFYTSFQLSLSKTSHFNIEDVDSDSPWPPLIVRGLLPEDSNPLQGGSMVNLCYNEHMPMKFYYTKEQKPISRPITLPTEEQKPVLRPIAPLRKPRAKPKPKPSFVYAVTVGEYARRRKFLVTGLALSAITWGILKATEPSETHRA